MLTKTSKKLCIILSLFLLTACDNANFSRKTNSQKAEPEEDTIVVIEPELPTDTMTVFEHQKERGVRVAVTNCSEINYNMYNAHPAGFEYELLKGFCDDNGLKLEMVLNDNLDSCFCLLDSCKVDVVATGVGLTKELKKKYFAPKILKINKVREAYGKTFWECDTDLGPLSFTVRETNRNLLHAGEDRIFVVDHDGCRYEIPSVSALDRKSFSRIELYL